MRHPEAMQIDIDQALIARIEAITSALTGPLQPRPTAMAPVLAPLGGMRALLFDVYGTLVISGCGDIGLTQGQGSDGPFQDAWSAAGLDLTAAPKAGRSALRALILEDHAASHAAGIDHPEVDILAIWRRLLEQQGVTADEALLRRLAVEYELRSNPVWPMPELSGVLQRLAARGLVLGIVSNAQFYTPLMLQAFLGQPLQALGFDMDCCAWSYRERVAKPSPAVYRPALQGLRERHGIAPAEVLYIGNDMRNDVRPAQSLGCRTGLFAGDARSLRLRPDDPGMDRVQADLVVTALAQLLEVVPPAR
jgi:putative hydrolase of the HAD superfamily